MSIPNPQSIPFPYPSPLITINSFSQSVSQSGTFIINPRPCLNAGSYSLEELYPCMICNMLFSGSFLCNHALQSGLQKSASEPLSNNFFLWAITLPCVITNPKTGIYLKRCPILLNGRDTIIKQPVKLGALINYSDTQPFEMGSHEMSTYFAHFGCRSIQDGVRYRALKQGLGTDLATLSESLPFSLSNYLINNLKE